MTATAGVTHDVTFGLGSDIFGYLLQQGTAIEETVNDFAPSIGVGDNPAFAEGSWKAWEQSGAVEGIDQRLFSNKQKILYTDGNIEHSRDGLIQLNSQWRSSDAAKTATTRMIIDFSTTFVVAGIGTKIRRFDTSLETWTDSTTTLGASALFLFEWNSLLLVACGAGADFYKSTDCDTFTQPTAGQKATCFCTFKEKIWLGHANNIKSSADATTWSAAVAVGDPQTNILDIKVAFNSMFIRKEEALYYTTDGSTIVEVYKNANTKYSGNQTLLYHADGFLYMGEMGTIKKFSISSGSITNLVDVTPNMDGDANKDLYGHGTPIYMWTGPGDVLYCAFNQGENTYPEVLKYNGLGWAQAYRGTGGATMSAGGYSRNMGYIFLNDGATRLRKMVTLKDWPRADYATTGELQTSFFDAQLPQMPKGFGSIRIWARNVTSARYITVYYRLISTDGWTQIGVVMDNVYPNPVTIPFDTSTKAIGANALQLRFVLTTDSAVQTPVMTDFSVKYLNRPLNVNGYSMTVNLSEGQVLLGDNGAETATMATRIGYLKKIKDSQVPIVYTDRQQIRHLVYISKLSKRNQVQPLDSQGNALEGQEVAYDIVCVDAYDGLLPFTDPLYLLFALAATGTLGTQTIFKWGVDAQQGNWSFFQWQ